MKRTGTRTRYISPDPMPRVISIAPWSKIDDDLEAEMCRRTGRTFVPRYSASGDARSQPDMLVSVRDEVCGAKWDPDPGYVTGLVCVREPNHDGLCSPMHHKVFSHETVMAYAQEGATHDD